MGKGLEQSDRNPVPGEPQKIRHNRWDNVAIPFLKVASIQM
jgi:hypothetical protein